VKSLALFARLAPEDNQNSATITTNGRCLTTPAVFVEARAKPISMDSQRPFAKRVHPPMTSPNFSAKGLVETRGGNAWWKRVVETRGGNAWWKRVVETRGGNAWWKRAVETCSGNVQWKRAVETCSGNVWLHHVVALAGQSSLIIPGASPLGPSKQPLCKSSEPPL